MNETPRARYWRSLDELQQSSDFEQYLDREFPVAASEFPEGVSRRRWLQLMGASLAMGGVVGCRYPEESIAPFVIRPEGRIPGESYERATNFQLAGRVYNLLISCVDGRPLKVEGNPQHPAGQGATDVFSQASILGLYDPDRKMGVSRRVEGELTDSSWEAFESYGRGLVEMHKPRKGEGFGVLLEPTASPSLVRMVEALRESLPEMTVCRYDSVRGDVMRQATQEAIGRPGEPLYELDQAKVVLSVQADLLGADVGFMRNARTFAAGRQPLEGEMSRLYLVEAGYSNTGASADSRLALRPTEMKAFLAELERRIDSGEAGDGEEGELAEKAYDELDAEQRIDRFIGVVAADLLAAQGESLVAVGEHLGADAVAAGIRINSKLGSLGKTLRFAEPTDASLEAVSLQDFVAQVEAGELDGLLVLGGNPVFAAPSDVDVVGALKRATDTIYWGDYEDETAVLCDWVLPASHSLESWGDVIDPEGYYGVCQPQILPLLGGRGAIEVIAAMLGLGEADGESIVRRTADALAGSSLSNRQWRKLLHDGFDETVKVDVPAARFSGSTEPLTDAKPHAYVELSEVDQDDIEIVFVPADGIYDGRFANNGWLQEMPQSLTKLTWDTAALMSPKTAEALKVKHGRMVALRRGEVTLELPVYEMPGMAHGAVVVAFGYGRQRAGAVGGHAEMGIPPVGIDVRPLRTSDSMLVAYEMESRPRSDDYLLATTQDHWAIDYGGRQETEDRSFRLVREGTMQLLDKVPEFTEAKGPHVPPAEQTQLWREPMEIIQQDEADPYVPQWGMSIDLSKCIGCNACVVACQSENNVPIVGKEQVSNSREMHWLRVDRYFQGTAENATVVQEPVACMHCETAPCEQVCPVAATVHTNEGINAMAYNRCIGTRYCANNCPFKVRRFNYFNYNEEVGVGYGIDAFPGTIETANRKLQQLVLNPEVTVRGRGVMEKCTYCIQRVEKAKIQARREDGRPLRDGDVQTACQTACPTRAIEFGNIQDPESRVAQLRKDPRSYGMLPQIKVKPRTTYLARIRNPHPRLMTLAQLEDLQELTHPHGGHEGAGLGEAGHGEAGHGEAGHGDAEHGDAGHGGEGHEPGEHSDEQAAVARDAAQA